LRAKIADTHNDAVTDTTVKTEPASAVAYVDVVRRERSNARCIAIPGSLEQDFDRQ